MLDDKPKEGYFEAASKVKQKIGQSMAAAKKEAFSIKQARGNPIYHAYLRYADDENYFRQSIICNVLRPLHEWHSTQNVELRIVQGTEAWLQAQCSGGYLAHIQATATTVKLVSVLGFNKCGFDEPDPSQMFVNSPQCAQQDTLAGYVGDMAVGTIGSRLVWGADFFHGLAKKFCIRRRDLAKPQLATAVINKAKVDVGLLDWAKRQPDVVINQ